MENVKYILSKIYALSITDVHLNCKNNKIRTEGYFRCNILRLLMMERQSALCREKQKEEERYGGER